MNKLELWNEQKLHKDIKFFTSLVGEENPPTTNEEVMHKAMEVFFDHQDLANKFIKIQPLHYDSSKIWWLWNWDKHLWEMIDETDILIKIDKLNDKKLNTISPQFKSIILESLRREARKNKPKDAPKTWVQFEDCIIDLKDKEIKRYVPSQKYFLTNTIPHRIGANTKTPNMDKIFEEWVGKEHVQTLYEIIAYCMLNDYPINRIFCLNGGGMNGKSKFMDIIKKFIGQINICSSDLDLLLTSRFEVTKLYKKLVCLMGETNFNELKKTALLKRLSGGDTIGFEMKGKTPFDDVNNAKIIISTNSLPITKDKTKGFYRRWFIINFINEFTEKKDILEDIPLKEYENLARKCIVIAKKLLISRSFTNEGNIEQRTQRYEDVSNPLQKFIKEKCFITDPDAWIYKWEFRDSFLAWMKENDYRAWSEKEIGSAMKEMFQETKKNSPDGEMRWRSWIGVRLRNLADLSDLSG